MNNDAATATRPTMTTVTAEDAPIGVQLWPTRHPRYAPNFTLLSVEVITRKLREASGVYDSTRVIWTYENLDTREFEVGEQVAVEIA